MHIFEVDMFLHTWPNWDNVQVIQWALRAQVITPQNRQLLLILNVI